MSLVYECFVCGEKFGEAVKFCPSCGAEQKKVNSIETDEQINEKVGLPNTEKKPSQSGSKKGIKTEPKEKSLSRIKLIYLIIFLLFVGSLIIYSSGIFDPPGMVTKEIKSADPHAGVDLGSLQRINELEEKVKTTPGDFNSILELAHLLNDSGFKEKAIDRYKEYLNENPNSADVLVDMGVCYFELGKNENAILNMEKAIKVEPKHQIAHLNLGIVNSSMGNKQKAVEYWQKTIQLNTTTEIAKRAQELINQQ